MNSLMLKDYRGRFPFKLSTTSYIYPDEIVPNVVRLGPLFDEIELVLFESDRPDSIPDSAQIDRLIGLSKLHRVGFNIHLPLDLSLGDERDDVRTHGISITRTMIERTLPLNPSVYTLHLDFINSPTPSLRKGERSKRNIKARQAEISPKFCNCGSLEGSGDRHLRAANQVGVFHSEQSTRKGAASILFRYPRPPSQAGATSSKPQGEGGKFVHGKDVEAWRQRVSRSLEEILNNGIEAKRISIETLAYPFEWIEDIVNQFGFSICLDIGHILTHGYDLGHYLKNYLPRTSIVHLHGVHKGSDHLGIEKMPEADLNLILSALRHYHGIVSIEVFSINALKSSLSTLEEKWTKG